MPWKEPEHKAQHSQVLSPQSHHPELIRTLAVTLGIYLTNLVHSEKTKKNTKKTQKKQTQKEICVLQTILQKIGGEYMFSSSQLSRIIS